MRGEQARYADPLCAEHFRFEEKEHGPKQTQSCPEVIKIQLLSQIENREWYEYRQGYDLLKNLQLAYIHRLMADSIRWNLNQVLEESDPPAYQSRNDPGAMRQILEVAIPGECHKNITETKKSYCCQIRAHLLMS